ncbi:MAG: hypothetical protein KF729_22035 [Sandaracinaceae bacterium]|nr:hypothetical protein [Sandaracinaceae bacterium]
MRHALLALVIAGCVHRTPPGPLDAALPDAGVDAGSDGGRDAAPEDAGPRDAGTLDPDAACASATVRAEVVRSPVDILWMVDNSTSMQPAIEQVNAGLNAFADLIAARDLDYRVIVLSLRGEGLGTHAGSARYRVCIPEPLAGPGCADRAPRFFQVELDVRSTQPLEQFLGTLGQTAGYLATDDRGSAPWQDLLRSDATKTIVVVTDDNARMVVRSGSGFVAGPTGGASGDPEATADWFETTSDTSDGSNPFSSRTLPEGILHPRWGGLFDGYVFSGLYGWGSETSPSVACTYPGGGTPPSSGPTYTALVARTGGVRARICDGPAAWGPFFDAVATAVERSSAIDCAIPIPAPPEGMFFERDRINVLVTEDGRASRIGKVADAAACDARGGWYYDDEAAPTEVVLCPSTCEAVQPELGIARGVDLQFGCQTIPI